MVVLHNISLLLKRVFPHRFGYRKKVNFGTIFPFDSWPGNAVEIKCRRTNSENMPAAALKSILETHLGGGVEWQFRQPPELVRTGISEVDTATGGLPRGCLTEIVGFTSSGRTSLLHSILAESTARDEVCALVDADDSFDPVSAARSGVRLHRLLWVRSPHNAESALKATDLLVQGGGFGLIAMDLGSTPPETARRISLTSWFRLRRAVEHTPTVLVAVARQVNAKTCASLILECERGGVVWSGEKRLLRAMEVRVRPQRRSKQCLPVFTAAAL